MVIHLSLSLSYLVLHPDRIVVVHDSYMASSQSLMGVADEELSWDGVGTAL